MREDDWYSGGADGKNPSSNAEDTGLIPGQGTRIPHAFGQLGPQSLESPSYNKDPMCHN